MKKILLFFIISHLAGNQVFSSDGLVKKRKRENLTNTLPLKKRFKKEQQVEKIDLRKIDELIKNFDVEMAFFLLMPTYEKLYAERNSLDYDQKILYGKVLILMSQIPFNVSGSFAYEAIPNKTFGRSIHLLYKAFYIANEYQDHESLFYVFYFLAKFRHVSLDTKKDQKFWLEEAIKVARFINNQKYLTMIYLLYSEYILFTLGKEKSESEQEKIIKEYEFYFDEAKKYLELKNPDLDICVKILTRKTRLHYAVKRLGLWQNDNYNDIIKYNLNDEIRNFIENNKEKISIYDLAELYLSLSYLCLESKDSANYINEAKECLLKMRHKPDRLQKMINKRIYELEILGFKF